MVTKGVACPKGPAGILLPKWYNLNRVSKDWQYLEGQRDKPGVYIYR